MYGVTATDPLFSWKFRGFPRPLGLLFTTRLDGTFGNCQKRFANIKRAMRVIGDRREEEKRKKE